jgi:hypothetical protein
LKHYSRHLQNQTDSAEFLHSAAIFPMLDKQHQQDPASKAMINRILSSGSMFHLHQDMTITASRFIHPIKKA